MNRSEILQEKIRLLRRAEDQLRSIRARKFYLRRWIRVCNPNWAYDRIRILQNDFIEILHQERVAIDNRDRLRTEVDYLSTNQ